MDSIKTKQLALVTAILFLFFVDIQCKGTIVCYYRNWAQYYRGKAKFLPEDIDPKLCSVINYSSMQINLYTYQIQGRQKNDGEMIRRIIALKKENPSLKVFVSVGKPAFFQLSSLPQSDDQTRHWVKRASGRILKFKIEKLILLIFQSISIARIISSTCFLLTFITDLPSDFDA